MDDWRNRILGALRRSKVLLICLSPAYFKSLPCKWEWEEYQARQHQKLIGSDSHATVYFVEVPGTDEQDNARRLEAIMGKNFTDLRPWFPAGAAAMREEAVRQRMAALGQSVWERIDRSRRALKVPGNIRGMTPYFVGRNRELAELHRLVGVGKIGLITAVHGLGGQGKTELAIAYARGYADSYSLGLWSLGAESQKELLPLIGKLGLDPRFGYTPTEAEKNDAELLGQAVLVELGRRAEAARTSEMSIAPAALLILDNVSEPELLAPAQVSRLPQADWLRIVVTTRRNPSEIDPSGKQLGTVFVDSLDPENALRLIVDHLPDGAFKTEQDKADAREIVRELGGLTLAVEQVAVFLGLNQGTSPGEYLAYLRAHGLPSTDDLVDSSAKGQIEHQSKLLRPILDSMLKPLADAGRTLLKFAALLPPERIPWPWLKELTARHHPELLEPRFPDAWTSLRRQVQGLRFLTGSIEDQSARMHRLISAHLQAKGDEAAGEELREYLAQRALDTFWQQSPPADWELDGLLEAIPHLLGARSDRQLAANATYLCDKVLSYRNLPTASALLSATHAVIQSFSASDAGNTGLQRELCASLERLGNVAVAQGKLSAAERHYTESLGIIRKLATSDAGNAEWQRDLSVSLNKLGDVALAQGKLSAAERQYAESLGIIRELAESDAGNAGLQRNLSVSLNNLGDVAVAQGKLVEAERHYAESLGICRKLAESDAGNAEWQRDLFVSLIKLGNAEVAQGELAAAERHYAESLGIIRKLAESDAGNTGWQRDLSVSLDRLGDVAVTQGNLAVAERHYAESLGNRRKLAESDTGNAGWQRDLSVSLERLGDVAVAQRKLAEAERQYAESLDIRRKLAESDAGNAGWQRALSVSLEKLGDVAVAQGELSAAERHYAESLGIRRKLAESDAGNAGWQRDLCVSLMKLGDVAVAQGKLSAAERHYAESLGIIRKLAESDAGNAVWQRDLWVLHWRIATLFEKQEQLAEARRHWQDAHEILQNIVARGLHVSPQDREFLEELRRKLGE